MTKGLDVTSAVSTSEGIEIAAHAAITKTITAKIGFIPFVPKFKAQLTAAAELGGSETKAQSQSSEDVYTATNSRSITIGSPA